MSKLLTVKHALHVVTFIALIGSSWISSAASFVNVESGDSLSIIAARHKSDTLSIEQYAIAIYNANSSAFTYKNVNSLKAGARLAMPTYEVAALTSEQQSFNIIQEHNNEWISGVRRRVGETKVNAQDHAPKKSVSLQSKLIQEQIQELKIEIQGAIKDIEGSQKVLQKNIVEEQN